MIDDINKVIRQYKDIREDFVDCHNDSLYVGDFVRINRVLYNNYKNQALYKICFHPFSGIYFLSLGIYRDKYLETFFPRHKPNFKYKSESNQFTVLQNKIYNFAFFRDSIGNPKFKVEKEYASIEKKDIEKEVKKVMFSDSLLCYIKETLKENNIAEVLRSNKEKVIEVLKET